MKHVGDITKLNGAELPVVDVITGGSPYCVYEYIFPDGMVYVGMTKHTIQRRRDNGYQHNPRLRSAARAVGWKNVRTVILAKGLSREEACKKEIDFIRKLNADNPTVGYNVSKGGASTYAGLKHTESYRRHMSEMYKGRTFSEETLKRMKDAHKGERKPVIMYSLNGEELVRHESSRAAALAVGGHATNIRRACNSGKAYKNYFWKDERG